MLRDGLVGGLLNSILFIAHIFLRTEIAAVYVILPNVCSCAQQDGERYIKRDHGTCTESPASGQQTKPDVAQRRIGCADCS